jgi:ATP-dependent Clp protease ATP-binding subunit ClpA
MILLQILDEGSITDSQGRKVDFKVIPLLKLLLSRV